MSPIIRRTRTIMIIETWTITWADGQATTWRTTREVVRPAVSEPATSLPPTTDNEDNDDGALDPDAADPLAEDG